MVQVGFWLLYRQIHVFTSFEQVLAPVQVVQAVCPIKVFIIRNYIFIYIGYIDGNIIFFGFSSWTIGPPHSLMFFGFIFEFYHDFDMFSGPRTGPKVVQRGVFGPWTK